MSGLVETVVDEAFILEMNRFKEKPAGKGLLEACSASAVLFAEFMLGVSLRAWQVKVLVELQNILEGKSEYREVVILTSRQIGKTTIAAIFADWLAVFNKRPSGIGNNTPVGLVSASDDQAKKMLGEMKKLLVLGDKFMERKYVDEDGKPKFGKKLLQSLIDRNAANNTDTITFLAYNKDKHGDYLLKGSDIGTFIKSYPPTSIVLGNTFAFLFVDEAGKSDRIPDAVFLDYLGPTVDEFQAPTVYTSTAWNTSGMFFEKCDVSGEKNDPKVLRLVFTIDAIKLEAPDRYADTMKKIDQYNRDGKTDEVQRAYYCRFVQGELNYFSQESVMKCFTTGYDMMEGFKGECDLGIDFGGQVTSRTVITVSCLDQYGIMRRIYHRSYEVGKDLSLLDDVAELMTRFNVQRIIPDDCPAGDFLIRTMIEKGWNVQPMNFRADKVKKYGAFRAALNRGEVLSYRDDALRTEMLAMEQSQTSKQSVIMHAPGYTDDLIDSFVMSCYFFLNDDEDEFNIIDDPEFIYGPSPFETQAGYNEDSYYEAKF